MLLAGGGLVGSSIARTSRLGGLPVALAGILTTFESGMTTALGEGGSPLTKGNGSGKAASGKSPTGP